MSVSPESEWKERGMKPELTPCFLALCVVGLVGCGPATSPPPDVVPPTADAHEADHDLHEETHDASGEVSPPVPMETHTDGAGGHAHHHGHAEAALIISGSRLDFELISPLANLLTFEHAPQNAAQEQALADLSLALSEASALLRTSDQAECTLLESRLKIERDGDHASLIAAYSLECRAMPLLREVTLAGFDAYPGLEEIDLVLITPDGQQAATLTADSPTLRLRT